jgi:hypothetical protein
MLQNNKKLKLAKLKKAVQIGLDQAKNNQFSNVSLKSILKKVIKKLKA